MVTFVGIVNITPDSFSDGGKFLAAQDAIARAYELFKSGCAVIDFGAQSTRPGAEHLSPVEEWQRLEPVITQLDDAPFEVSIDTFYPEVIEKVRLVLPRVIINDVTTAHNHEMRTLVARSGLRIFLSHLPFSANGDIQTAHNMTPIDDIHQVADELMKRRDELLILGATPEQIILDPGIGFGKTMRLNAELVEFAREIPGIPVLIGFSRKRFIEQFLLQDRFDPTVNAALSQKAAQAGATYLRVHQIY